MRLTAESTTHHNTPALAFELDSVEGSLQEMNLASVADTLGSTRLVTNATGGVVECYDYLPFGEELGRQ